MNDFLIGGNIMNRKESVEAEIEQHLATIKDLRIELEKEEKELELCYQVLNLINSENK